MGFCLLVFPCLYQSIFKFFLLFFLKLYPRFLILSLLTLLMSCPWATFEVPHFPACFVHIFELFSPPHSVARSDHRKEAFFYLLPSQLFYRHVNDWRQGLLRGLLNQQNLWDESAMEMSAGESRSWIQCSTDSNKAHLPVPKSTGHMHCLHAHVLFRIAHFEHHPV